MQKYENFAKSDQIFPKFYVMTGTQKEVKFTVFIFRTTMSIPQKLLLGQFRVQNFCFIALFFVIVLVLEPRVLRYFVFNFSVFKYN